MQSRITGLSADQVAAITSATAPTALNPFQTLADIPALSADQVAAITSATAPSSANPFQTLAELAAQSRVASGQASGIGSTATFNFGDTNITAATHHAIGLIVDGSAATVKAVPSDTSITAPGVVQVNGAHAAGDIVIVFVSAGAGVTPVFS